MDRNPALAQAIHDCGLCPLATSRRGVAVPSMPGKYYIRGGVAIMSDIVVDVADSSEGVPFTGGRAEVRLLEGMLTEAGLSRDDVLIMFRVRCSPTEGRVDDYPEAIFNCDSWTEQELDAYDPGCVVLMGNTVLESTFGKQAKVTRTRGKPRATKEKYRWGSRCWVATFHPYAVMKSPGNRARVVNDLRLAHELCADRVF